MTAMSFGSGPPRTARKSGSLRVTPTLVRAFAFTPDGATLYSGSQDTMILAWDLKPFQQKVK